MDYALFMCCLTHLSFLEEVRLHSVLLGNILAICHST